MPLRDAPSKKNLRTNVDESDSTEEGELSDGNVQSSQSLNSRDRNGEPYGNDQERKISADKGEFPPRQCNFPGPSAELLVSSMLTFQP